MDILLYDYVLTLGRIFALVIIMGVAVPILIWIIDKLTGEMKVWRELKKKNNAVAIVIASVILGFSLIIALAV